MADAASESIPLITSPEIEQYLDSLLPPRDEVLVEMERQAAARDIPIVGPVVARLLHQLACLHGARRIFEFGSAIGYSTLWWALAVGERGEVFYTDTSSERSEEAAGYFRQAGVEGRIRQLVGDAGASFDSTGGSFDIIFIDHAKLDYLNAFRKSLPRLRPGGLIIADNVLWKGRVAAPGDSRAETQAMREFNRAIYAEPHLFSTILPLRDGLAICRKH